MSMISVAVNSLARLGIAPAVQALGRRHAGYGVQKHHYAVVEASLIWTLAVGLDDKFTRETEEAWRTAYRVLATTMQSDKTEEKPMQVSPQPLDTAAACQVHRSLQAHPLGHRQGCDSRPDVRFLPPSCPRAFRRRTRPIS